MTVASMMEEEGLFRQDSFTSPITPVSVVVLPTLSNKAKVAGETHRIVRTKRQADELQMSCSGRKQTFGL